MAIELFSDQHHHWQAYLSHAERHNMQRWIVDDNLQPLADVYYLGYAHENQVVGHITLKKQPIEVPQTPWSDMQDYDHLIRDKEDNLLEELFVQTFAVDEAHRRQGIGTQLQTAGLALGKMLKCYQMRAWSSLDKTSNYQLKIKLGFAIQPGFYELSSGERISGVYFVLRCEN